jgi:phage/plasmid-like protein (TIGR03299 family)
MKGFCMSQKNFFDYEKLALESGLAWKVEKKPLFDEKGNQLPVYGTFRSDTNVYFGTVSEQYNEVQNIELLKMPELLEQAGTKVEFVRAGEMNGGERVFAEYKLPFSVDIKKIGDIVQASIVSSTRHNGKGSVMNNVYLNRLVCTNGMTLKTGYALQYARHNKSVSSNIEEMKTTLINAAEDVKSFGELANNLASILLSTEDIRAIVEKIFHDSDTNNIYVNSHKQEKARGILAIFEANDNNTFKKQKGTAWNLLNAFTNYTDHRANYRTSNGETTEQAKIRGAMFGAGHAFKWHALSCIAEIAGKNHGLIIPESFKKDLTIESVAA